jgi:hypothetical protein
MNKPGDSLEPDGSRCCFRAVVERSDAPIGGVWLVKFECGHRAQMIERGAGVPVGARCGECEAG